MEIPYPECGMAMNTEGGHVVDSVSRMRNGYEYGRRSRGRFRIPNTKWLRIRKAVTW